MKGGDRVRFWSYTAAAVVGVLAIMASIEQIEEDGVYVIPVVAVAGCAVAALALRRWTAPIFALAGGFLALWTPDLPTVWPAVGALVFLSIAEDPRPQPWLGWVGGLAGSTLSLWFQGDGSAAPFLATFIGGGAGLLLRSRTRLVGEAEELRGQAAWLEQRTSVARELHDVVGHHVTAMVVQAEAGQVADPHVALRAIGELGRTALAELDSLVVHLRDPGAPLTVSAPPRLLDIDELLAEPLRRAGMAVDVRLGEGLALAEADVLTIYRITQEALTNVARHSGASHAWVEVSREDAVVRLRVSDDGAGPPAERTRGSGLLGIEERVAARGGRVELIGRPGGGAMLDVTVPLGEQ